MPFYVTIIVLLVSYILKFKEDFDKEKLEKAGLVLFVVIIIFALFYWVMH